VTVVESPGLAPLPQPASVPANIKLLAHNDPVTTLFI
jgi:hypothetical protein